MILNDEVVAARQAADVNPTTTYTPLLAPLPEQNASLRATPITATSNVPSDDNEKSEQAASATPTFLPLSQDELEQLVSIQAPEATPLPLGKPASTATPSPTDSTTFADNGRVTLGSPNHGNLPTATILGIVFGILGALLFFALVGWFGWKRRALRRKRRAEAQRAGRQIEEGKMAEKDGIPEMDLRGATEWKEGRLSVPTGEEQPKRSMEKWVDVTVV